MCDPVQSRSQSANLQKLQSCQIPGVKWINGNRNHVKFSAFENWLSARLRYLQCLCYWDADLKLGHKSIYGLLNLAKLGSGNGLLPEGNWTPSHLCTFADYYWVIINDTLWHLTWFHWKYKIQSLKFGRDKMAIILQTSLSNAFFSIKLFAFLSIFRRTLFPWAQCVRKEKLFKIYVVDRY